MTIGTSLRFALAVGLHLRNDDSTASPFVKESLVQLWWSINSIESQVCALIGRPSIILNDACTVPLPQGTTLLETTSSYTANQGEEGATMHISFLRARIGITIIMQKTLSKLYLPRISTESWERTHTLITTLTSELDEWAKAVPPEGFSLMDSVEEQDVQREQSLLSFHHYSARLLISRPSLCRLERRIKGQSHASAAFNHKTAKACVQAAQAITRLFPDQPDWIFVCQRSPWWCIVHHIMQAIAVFLLEMSFEGTDTIQNGEELSENIEKLVRWLRFLSSRSAVAERAYKVVLGIIKTNAARVRTDKSELGAGGQVIPPSNYPAATTNTGIQSATSVEEEEQLVQESGLSELDQYFMLDPVVEMPSIFGNPFNSAFDQFSLPHNTSVPDRSPPREDARMQ
jgi:hypothetical protein